MRMMQRMKNLWALSARNDAAERLEERIGDLKQQIEAMSVLLANLLKEQAELRQLAETTRREAESAVGEVRRGADALSGALAKAEAAAEGKVRALETQAGELLAEVRRQVEACREEAEKTIPELRRLADGVRDLNS